MKNHDKFQHPIDLVIFEKFKTRNNTLTRTALRQRGILEALANASKPEKRTRTEISRHISRENSGKWKNVYSGIFHDIDNVLIPLGLVEEAGRIPPKRGPKALQKLGIPYYHLTEKGRLVDLAVSSFDELEKKTLALFSSIDNKDARVSNVLVLLAKFSPRLARLILQEYVKSYCNKEIKNLFPLTITKLRKTNNEWIKTHLEFLEGALSLDNVDRKELTKFLSSISTQKDSTSVS